MSNWKDDVPEYLILPEGESRFTITGEPVSQTNKWGRKQLAIQTDHGVWRIGCESPVSRELKLIAIAAGRLSGTEICIKREGQGKNTVYTLITANPPEEPKQASLPFNREAFDKLSPEEQNRLLKKLSMQQ